MADKQVMLTEEGYNKLVEKLNYLKSVKRIEIAELSLIHISEPTRP